MEKSDSFETDENKPKRSSSSSSNSTLLPNLYIFCGKDVKYKKRKPEQLRRCGAKQIRETLEKCAKEKNDYRITSVVSTNDIVAAEAKYHPSCYAHHTRPKKLLKPKDNQSFEYKKIELEALLSEIF